jgi:hypothetical protein
MKTLINRIADYLRTCVHDNVGETRAYIDPDNIDFMARDIQELTAVRCDTCECDTADKIMVRTFGRKGGGGGDMLICKDCAKAIVSTGELLEIL